MEYFDHIINVKLPKSVVKEIDELTKKLHITRSNLLRMIISEYLEKKREEYGNKNK